MDVSNDKDAYVLASVVSQLENEKEGTALLSRYLLTTGKIENAVKFLGADFKISNNEIQYLLQIENICKILKDSVGAFLQAVYNKRSFSQDDPTVLNSSLELISLFKQLKGIKNSGWEEMTRKLLNVVLKIEALTKRLIAMHTSGKKVCFDFNVSAEDFFKADEINFDGNGYKYFKTCIGGGV